MKPNVAFVPVLKYREPRVNQVAELTLVVGLIHNATVSGLARVIWGLYVARVHIVLLISTLPTPGNGPLPTADGRGHTDGLYNCCE